jgi:hypothetical protein
MVPNPFHKDSLSSRAAGTPQAGPVPIAKLTPLLFRIATLFVIFIVLDGTSSAQSAGLSAPSAPSDTPIPVVSEVYNEWTLNAGLLYWGEGACGGEIRFDGYLRRLPVNGGNQITLGTVDPTTCSTYFSIIADNDGVYYYDADVGPQIEFRASGSPTVARQVLKLTASQIPDFNEDRLGVDGNYIYWFTPTQLLRVRKDGTDFGTVVASLSSPTDVYVTNGNVYWLDSTGLWTTTVGCGSLPCSKRQLSAVAGSHLMYYNQSSIIIQAGPHFDYIAGQTIHHVVCPLLLAFCNESTLYTVPSDGNTWDLGRPATDGTNLFWEEGYFNIPGTPTGRLRRMPLNGGTFVDIATNLYMSPGPVYIDTNYVYFPSVDNSVQDILKLPLNASALVRDLTADAIEVTQGIQNLANDVPLVSGKPTFVRAYGLENSGPSALAVDAYLYGTRNSVPLPGSPLHPIRGRIAISTGITYVRANLNSGWLFQLPDSWTQAGNISLHLVVDPLQTYMDPNLTNNTLDHTAAFSDRQSVCNIFIPVHTDAPIPSTNIANFSQMIDYAQRLWPTPSYISYSMDGSMDKLTICTWHGIPYPCYRPFHLPDDTWELFIALGEIDIVSDLTSSCSPLFYSNHYVGMVDPATDTGDTTGVGNYVLPLTWVKFSDDLAASNDPFAPSSGETLAHELAHNLGRKHVDCGGPSDVDTNYPYPTNQIDNIGNANHYGFDVKSLTPIAPGAANDVMSYCTPKWISDYNWKALFNGLAPLFTAAQPPALPALANAASDILVTGAVTPTANTGELGYAWNFPVSALSSQSLQRWQQLSDANAAAISASSPLTVTYHVRLLGPTGAILADQTVIPVEPHVHQGSSLTNVFIATFPAPVGTVAKVELMQDNTVLTSRSPGADVPSVTILNPAGGEVITGQLNLSWKTQDLDQNDVLHYMVQYSPDNGKTWRALVSEMGNLPGATTTSLTLQLSATPGSLPSGALIRVAASDGYNTGIGVSKPFTITDRKPQPFILTPAPGDTSPAGQDAVLRGGASDAEDGIINGAALSWTVDGQSSGTGEQVTLPGLAPGDHAVTLTAHDAVSQTAAAQATLTILPLSIPTGISPTLDGYCDDASYTNATQVLLKPFPGGSQANARLLNDNSAIWICFSGLKSGAASPGSFAGVHIDVNHSRDNLAQSDDYGFFAGEDGSVLTTAGDGAGGFANPGPGGLTARISATANGWSAELRIDASVIGGLNHVVGLDLGQYSVAHSGDDYIWPYSSIFNQPKTWATAGLGALPVIGHLNPASASLGSLGFTLVISGQDFVNGSEVVWNGTPLSTTFGTSSVISATLKAAQLNAAGTFPVVVRNPGSIDSGPAPFNVDNPQPVIASLLPASTQADGPAFTLHVNGSSFVNGAKVFWNGQELATTFVNSGQLTAQVAAGLISSGQVVSITVLNPSPGGGASGPVPFTIRTTYGQFLPVVKK